VTTRAAHDRHALVRLRLLENLPQFALLVIVNACVGAMVGMERSSLPAIAEHDFDLAARTAILSFIVVFGVSKAMTNYVAGRLADRVGRKRVLVAGWLIATPVPFLLMWAPSWNWILAANVLLGVSQGFTWSTTVIMKIDLVGSRRRGLAMGLNEFAGYVAVAAAALATGWIAARTGLRPEPFYLGVVFVIAGLGLSAALVRETAPHVALESNLRATSEGVPTPREVFWRTSIADRNLSSISQAGLVNNLNDGMAWGLFPLVFADANMSLARIGVLAAIGDVAHPVWRASSVGVYRLWRDLGYAIGALVAGITADFIGLSGAMWVVAGLTAASGFVAAFRMRETLQPIVGDRS